MGKCSSKNQYTQPQNMKTKSKSSQFEQDKKIKMEAVFKNLETQIKNFEDKQKKLQSKIDAVKKQAKQLLQNDKKTEVKKLLQAATKLKKQSQAFALRRKAIQGRKFQLQQAGMNMQTINVLNGVQQHLKDTEEYNKKLQDVILNNQQQKQLQDQINDKLNGLVQEEEDIQGVDDMMAEIKQEIRKQKMGKIQQKNVNTKKTNNQHNEQNDQLLKMLEKL